MKLFSDDNMKKVQEIVYHDLRGVHDMSKKMTITTIVLVAMHDHHLFSELLYDGNGIEYWIDKVNDHFNKESGSDEIYIEQMYSDKLLNEIFESLKQSLIKQYDDKEFYKSIYEKDEYALQIISMCKEIEDFENVVL